MDVFLQNVPPHMAEETLKKELIPLMNALGIADEWECQKPKQKPFAFVRFLRRNDAQGFLQKHGPSLPSVNTIQTGVGPHRRTLFGTQPISQARLHILGKAVKAVQSKHPIDPVLHAQLRSKKEKEKKQKRDPRAPSLTAVFHRISCGKMIFLPDGQLAFARETSWNTRGKAAFGRQALVLTLEDSLERCTRLHFSYGTVVGFMANSQRKTMTLVLTEPPRMYQREQTTTFPLAGSGRSSPPWLRTSAVNLWRSHSSFVSHCLVYELLVADEVVALAREIHNRERISVENVNLSSVDAVEDSYWHSITSLQSTLEDANRENALPYVILFQLERLVWDNYLHPSLALRLFHAMRAHVAECTQNRTETFLTTDSIKRCLVHIPYPVAGTDPDELSASGLLADFITAEQNAIAAEGVRSKTMGAHAPPNQVWILRAIVTPSRVTLAGPDPETGNKVLRRFQDYSTYFMRVTFADEDGQDLSYHPKISNEPIFERYESILQKGIKVAGRAYEFLGFSHSSLRSHSAWFMAPFVDSNHQRHDRESILRTLGNFEAIRTPAKCAARIGQAFSETPYAVNVKQENIRIQEVDDVKRNGHIFSDGVGTISPAAAMVLWTEFPSLSAATCFQIRWAGCKGMLSLDERLPGKQINMRPSMNKFDSEDSEELGICDAATRPLRLVLNRQMIKILEDMGTDLAWFVTLQGKAIDVLKDVTAEAANAGTFLEYQLVGTSIGVPQFIRYLDKLRIPYLRDGFLKSIVEHVVLRELRLLKHKARIPVADGVTLFGVMDETGYLEEKEVFFSFDGASERKQLAHTLPKEGAKVIVTRSPALHPGDVQLARMRYPPKGHALCQLRNCIVFSQKGRRDLPSQLSGGDLDGDIYNIIWDPRAMPQRAYLPGEYPRVSPQQLDRSVTKHDIAKFFVDFMRTDILGLIANRHQIIADAKDQGTLDGDCLKLAGLHSAAVDYSKTGIAVSMSDLPQAPKSKPDFLAPVPPLKLYDLGQIAHIADDDSEDDEDESMSRLKPRYHESKKILGKLYRAIDEKKIWKNDIHRQADVGGPSVWEQLFGLAVRKLKDLGVDHEHSHLADEAQKIQTYYEAGIENLRWHFSESGRTPLTEVETFCGYILNKNGAQTNRQRNVSIKLKEETDRVLSDTMDLIRKLNNPQDRPEDDMRGPNAARLSLACLAAGLSGANTEQTHVGAARATKASAEASGLVSFQVVAGCCLMRELNIMEGERNMGGGYIGVYGTRMKQDVLTDAMSRLEIESS